MVTGQLVGRGGTDLTGGNEWLSLVATDVEMEAADDHRSLEADPAARAQFREGE